MNAKLLYELKLELDRIYITGMRLAKNNSRIQKILPVLEMHIEEDTAYRELVDNLKELIDPLLFEWTEILAKIHASLYYLLRLHEEVAVSGEEKMEQLPVFKTDDMFNQYSFLELKPLVDALMGIGKKRLEIITKAREDKLFNDLRIYTYLDKALADKETEIADLAEDIIKNELGDKMFPFMLNSFELNDADENLRRLRLLYELKYEGMSELVDEILEGNAVSLQAKAIQYMSNDVAHEEQIMALAENPQKLLREKAYLGLVALNTEKTENRLYDLYVKALKKRNKGELELIIKALSQMELRYTFGNVLAQAKEVFNGIITANKKADIDQFGSLRMAISLLKQKNKPEVYDFFYSVLFDENYNGIIDRKKPALNKPAKDVSYAIIDVAQGLDSEQLMEFYKKVINKMPESEWKLPFYKMYLKACVRAGNSVEEVYDIFAPYYQSKRISIEDIAELCNIDHQGNAFSKVDNRWIDRLYEALECVDEECNIDALLRVLNALEIDSPERYNQNLIKAGKETKKYLLEITTMIMERNVPDKYEVVFSLIKYSHDQGSSRSNALRQLPRAMYWYEFPKEYAAKFRELKNAPRAIYTKIAEG